MPLEVEPEAYSRITIIKEVSDFSFLTVFWSMLKIGVAGDDPGSLQCFHLRIPKVYTGGNNKAHPASMN